MTIDKLAIDLDRSVRTLRNLLNTTNHMHTQHQLGSAARIPDELARAIACIESCRNAATYEAIGSQLQELEA